MITLRLPLLREFALFLIVVAGISCMPSATSLRHSGSFSNIRSEIIMNDGSILRGYASMNAIKGEEALRVRVQGERHERMIPLSKIDRLVAEEHEFVVKWLQTPTRAAREGKPSKVRAMVRRMGMEADVVQLFEYKYAVSNPKSPISNTMTAWFVSFPNDPETLPLCELNSSAYKKKWADLQSLTDYNSIVSTKAPHSVKGLMEQVRIMNAGPKGDNMQHFGAAE